MAGEGTIPHFADLLFTLHLSYIPPIPFHYGRHFDKIIDFYNKNKQPNARSKRGQNFLKIQFFNRLKKYFFEIVWEKIEKF